VVNAVVVVEREVGGEFAAQAGGARVDVARERGAPALVEDRLVERFDVAVGLWSAGMDAAVVNLEALEGLFECVAAKFVAVV